MSSFNQLLERLRRRCMSPRPFYGDGRQRSDQEMTAIYSGELEKIKKSLNAGDQQSDADDYDRPGAVEAVKDGSEEITRGNEDLVATNE